MLRVRCLQRCRSPAVHIRGGSSLRSCTGCRKQIRTMQHAYCRVLEGKAVRQRCAAPSAVHAQVVSGLRADPVVDTAGSSTESLNQLLRSLIWQINGR